MSGRARATGVAPAPADLIGNVRRALGAHGEAAVRLAYHAALPVVVNCGLLNLLRVNFFLDPPDDLPYEVEAELLMSPLFREVSEGLYEIDPELRNLLLTGDPAICQALAEMCIPQWTEDSGPDSVDVVRAKRHLGDALRQLGDNPM
jgi:hypothetical protein